MRRLVWLGVAVALVLAIAGLFPARYVLAPLLGLLILQFGLASLRSFRNGASYIPDGPPQPVDTRTERVEYTCGGCGAELLLLVRGTPVPPRHCGERMHERRMLGAERSPSVRGEPAS
jgi:DNA-directed RNA polymerase subunit RPC12/RpoP